VQLGECGVHQDGGGQFRITSKVNVTIELHIVSMIG
jgi:hypothetical protein